MSTAYRPLLIPHERHRLPFALSKEAAIWSNLEFTAKYDFPHPVADLAFSPVSPFNIAVAFGSSISLVSSRGHKTQKTFSRFHDIVYSPHFKSDGRLLVAGTEDFIIKVFDVNRRTPLRQLTNHTGAVQSVRFSNDGLRILSGSDDRTVRVWDLAEGKSLHTFTEATDYVRAQNGSPSSPHVWLTGSVDQKARLYDLRSCKVVFTLDQQSQVDDVHFLSGGSRVITVGGPEVRIWDLFAGGQLIKSFTCHAKAATSAAVDYSRNRLATSGLDGYVKIHDLASFQTHGVLSVGSPVLSLDVSADGHQFGLGLADGGVSVLSSRIRLPGQRDATVKLDDPDDDFVGWGRGFKRENEHVGFLSNSQRYFNRGPTVKPSELDVVIEHAPVPKLDEYDKHLKAFDHSRSLDAALDTKNPSIVLAVIDELTIRGALVVAISGRDYVGLCPLLEFIEKNLRRSSFTKKLVFLLNIIIDMYASHIGSCAIADRHITKIQKLVTNEVKFCRDLMAIQGGVEMVTRVGAQLFDSPNQV